MSCRRLSRYRVRTVRIRAATEEDVSHILRIAQQVHGVLTRDRPPHLWGERAEFSSAESFYLQALRGKDGVLFVAEIGEGKVVGYVLAAIEREPDDLIAVPYMSVIELAVEVTHRRAGIGHLLMDRVHEWAREHGLNILQLAVWEFNRDAVEFYENLGYVTILRKMERRLE